MQKPWWRLPRSQLPFAIAVAKISRQTTRQTSHAHRKNPKRWLSLQGHQIKWLKWRANSSHRASWIQSNAAWQAGKLINRYKRDQKNKPQYSFQIRRARWKSQSPPVHQEIKIIRRKEGGAHLADWKGNQSKNCGESCWKSQNNNPVKSDEQQARSFAIKD